MEFRVKGREPLDTFKYLVEFFYFLIYGKKMNSLPFLFPYYN